MQDTTDTTRRRASDQPPTDLLPIIGLGRLFIAYLAILGVVAWAVL